MTPKPVSEDFATATDYKLLKPCPHCGHKEPVITQLFSRELPWRVSCKEATCGMRTPWLRMKGLAFTIWNRRPKRRPRVRQTAANKLIGD